MSVIMTLRVSADPQKVESVAAENPGRMQEILEAGEAERPHRSSLLRIGLRRDNSA